MRATALAAARPNFHAGRAASRHCCLPHVTKPNDQKRFFSNERCENLLPLRRPLVPHYFREARVECKLRRIVNSRAFSTCTSLLLTSRTFDGSQFNGMTSSTPASIR
jgi:hypothetical protein